MAFWNIQDTWAYIQTEWIRYECALNPTGDVCCWFVSESHRSLPLRAPYSHACLTNIPHDKQNSKSTKRTPGVLMLLACLPTIHASIAFIHRTRTKLAAIHLYVLMHWIINVIFFYETCVVHSCIGVFCFFFLHTSHELNVQTIFIANAITSFVYVSFVCWDK